MLQQATGQVYTRMKVESAARALVFMLQLVSGARISEVLNVRSQDIVNSQQVIIRGLKGSRDRLITLLFESDYLKMCYITKRQPFAGLDRFKMYRFYKRYGIVLRTKSGTNNKVTHRLRYDYILKIQSFTHNIDSTADLVGHKSTHSTSHYLSNLNKIKHKVKQ